MIACAPKTRKAGTILLCAAQSILHWTTEHRSSIGIGDERNPVAAHFKKAGHNLNNLRYVGVEKVEKQPRGGDLERLLLQRETYWIYFLNIMSPDGLNEEFEIKPFL